MNDYDRNNLNFIMSLDDEQFEAWTREISDDDIQYAIELIKQSRVEIADQAQALTEANLVDSDFAEANAVLKKFML